MPDPIRCSVDPSQANHTVSCEPIAVGPTTKSTPPRATPSSAPAVTALVKRFPPGNHEVHAKPVDTVTVNSAEQCLGQINAMTVLLLGVKGPLLGAAGGFKVGYDLGACVAKDVIARQQSADQKAALQECAEQDGTPVAEIGHTLICERPAVTP